MPDVPTVSEAGVPGYDAVIWLGIMVPAGTPKPIVDRLNAEIQKVLAQPEVKADFAKQGAVPMQMSADEFGEVHGPGHREVGQGGQGLRREGRLTAPGRGQRPSVPSAASRRRSAPSPARRGREGSRPTSVREYSTCTTTTVPAM